MYSYVWPTSSSRISIGVIDIVRFQLHTTHRSGDLSNRPSALGSVGQPTRIVDRYALSNCVMNNISTHLFIYFMLIHSLTLTIPRLLEAMGFGDRLTVELSPVSFLIGAPVSSAFPVLGLLIPLTLSGGWALNRGCSSSLHGCGTITIIRRYLNIAYY